MAARPIPVAPGLLTREAILATPALPTQDVAVPEWGGSVRVKALTARALDQVESRLSARRKAGDETPLNARAEYLVASLVGEDGEPLFASIDDVVALGEKSGFAVDRIFDVVIALNKMGATAVKVEVKN